MVPALYAFSDAPEVPVTVIGSPSTDMKSWAAALEHDAGAMTAFFSGAGNRAAIEAYEVRIPNHRDVVECIRDLKAFEDIDVYVELPWGQGMDDSLAAIAGSEWLGAKARTGGTQASAFPTAAELGEFIHGAVSLDLPFKLTAGLHHPFPNVDADTGARAHGFINVIAATGFAITHDMSRGEIEDVLLGGAQDDWIFGDQQLSFCDQVLSITQIEDARDLFESFGACSVQDGLADLRSLGLYLEGKPSA